MDRVDLHLGIGLDTSDLRRLAKDLRAAKSPLLKGMRQGLRAAGEIVAADARVRAEEASKTIPPSIKVRVASTTVAVVAGGPGVPLAGLMEIGNKKSAKGATTFRHPVFGNRTRWVDQPMHPYLAPAGRAHEAEVERAVADVIDGVLAAYITRGG